MRQRQVFYCSEFFVVQIEHVRWLFHDTGDQQVSEELRKFFGKGPEISALIREAVDDFQKVNAVAVISAIEALESMLKSVMPRRFCTCSSLICP